MVAAENNSAKGVQRVQCVWDVLSIPLFSCWIDLHAHTKHQAVPALRELIVLRFPRWKNGSMRWMGMQKKSLRDSSHKPEQGMGGKNHRCLCLLHAAAVNLKIVSFLMVCDCSYVVVERCSLA